MLNFFAKLVPFVLLGIALVALAFGLMLIAYLLVFGAIVGFVLFAISWIRERFFPSKQVTRVPKRRGRTIDHQD